MKPITALSQLDPNGLYSYADYMSWQFKERVELIKGRIFRMSPAPNRKHQKISNFINVKLYTFLSIEECEVYTAPFDVLLSKGDNSTVVQPDICVVCDKSKLTEQGCTGAPDIIVEILSPGNSRKEMKEKFELYEENGVQEYWMVNPLDASIIIYRLDKNNVYYGTKPFVPSEKVQSKVLRGFEIDVAKVFAE